MSIHHYTFIWLCVVAAIPARVFSSTSTCQRDFWTIRDTGIPLTCHNDSIPKDKKNWTEPKRFPNIPSLTGAFCYNNQSGLCKGFSGRFEFQFNTDADQILGPMSKYSSDIDEFGYHLRVPVSYNIRGHINYADSSINWARQFQKEHGGKHMSLLSTKDFNWCEYAKDDNWPYKSAIKDAKSDGRYHIYFYNHQSCIIDTQTGQQSFSNSRFVSDKFLEHPDLDINPTIFAMEDGFADPPYDIRLVRYRLQASYEVSFSVVRTTEAKYLVKVSKYASRGKIKDAAPFFGRDAYRRFSDACIGNNSRLGTELEKQEVACGFGTKEVIGESILKCEEPDGQELDECMTQTILPSIESPDETIQNDFITRIKSLDGAFNIIFASTNVPSPNDKYKIRELVLRANYINETKQLETMIVEVLYNYNVTANVWQSQVKSQESVPNLNYVDDIAYLYKCRTILVIFGPLYSELPEDQFDVSTARPVHSIYDLSIWELATAFFNKIGTNELYVFHRTNWVQKLAYTCGQDESLSTAKKVGRYFPVAGVHANQNLGIKGVSSDYDTDVSEEYFWELLKIFKGDRLSRIDAPDPELYNTFADRTGLWIYTALSLVILVTLVVCIAVVIIRRRRRAPQESEVETVPIFSPFAGKKYIPGGANESHSRIPSASAKLGTVRSRMSSSSSSGSSTGRKRLSMIGSKVQVSPRNPSKINKTTKLSSTPGRSQISKRRGKKKHSKKKKKQ